MAGRHRCTRRSAEIAEKRQSKAKRDFELQDSIDHGSDEENLFELSDIKSETITTVAMVHNLNDADYESIEDQYNSYVTLEKVKKERQISDDSSGRWNSRGLRKRGSAVLTDGYSKVVLNDISGGQNGVSPKRAHLARGSAGGSAQAQSSKDKPTTPERSMRRGKPEDTLKALREKYKNDSLKMFIADYIDASMERTTQRCINELQLLRTHIREDVGIQLAECEEATGVMGSPVHDYVYYKSRLEFKIPIETPQDFDDWENKLNMDNKANIHKAIRQRTALMDFMRFETSASNDCAKDVKRILASLIMKAVQMEYSAIGRMVHGVGKKNFSATATYICMRDFLTSKYSKSDKDLKIISAVSEFLSQAPSREGGRRDSYTLHPKKS